MEEGLKEQTIKSQIPNWLLIVATVLITSLITGGGVYAWQNSKTRSVKEENQQEIESLNQEISSLQTQLQNLKDRQEQKAQTMPGGLGEVKQERVVFARRKQLHQHAGDQQYNEYSIYTVNLDDSSLTEILSYKPQIYAGSIIDRFSQDKIRIYRFEKNDDAKIFNLFGQEISQEYTPAGITPVRLYLSPEGNRSLYQTGAHEFTIYDFKKKKGKSFPVDFGVPGEVGILGFVTADYISIGWGDVYAVKRGLVQYNFDSGGAAVIDQRNFSSLGRDLRYLTGDTILGYKVDIENFQRIPPSVIFTQNIQGNDLEEIYRNDELAISQFYFSHDRKRITFHAEAEGHTGLTSLLILGKVSQEGEVNNLREIDVSNFLPLSRVYWTKDKKRIVYFTSPLPENVDLKEVEESNLRPTKIVVMNTESGKLLKTIDISTLIDDKNETLELIGVLFE